MPTWNNEVVTMDAGERTSVAELLGPDAESLLNYKARGFPKTGLHLPGPDFVDPRRREAKKGPTALTATATGTS